MTDTEAVFEQLKHEIDRARRTGMSVRSRGRRAFATRPCICG